MRALVCKGYGAGENLALESRPLPEPGPGEVRVRVLACGANASDWEFVTGRPFYARIARWFMRGRDVYGSDVVGVVEALGPGCGRLRTGERVLADTFGAFGGFAEFCVAKEALWVPVPAGIPDIHAAALPQSGTIALTAMKGRATPGMRVLVNGGGGGSGPLAIQLAAAAGAEVWAVDTAAKAEVMREAGAVRTLDFEAEDFAARVERFDLILDLYGTRSMRRVRRALNPGGAYLMVGGPLPRVLAAAFAAGRAGRVAGDGRGRNALPGGGRGHLARLRPRRAGRHGRTEDRRQAGDRAVGSIGAGATASAPRRPRPSRPAPSPASRRGRWRGRRRAGR